MLSSSLVGQISISVLVRAGLGADTEPAAAAAARAICFPEAGAPLSKPEMVNILASDQAFVPCGAGI